MVEDEEVRVRTSFIRCCRSYLCGLPESIGSLEIRIAQYDVVFSDDLSQFIFLILKHGVRGNSNGLARQPVGCDCSKKDLW